MNFFRNRSLKQLSIILSVGFFSVIVLQIFWLQTRFNRIESVQFQIDFIRSLQLNNQRLALQLQQAGQEGRLSPATISLANQQDLQFQLVEKGGRIPGSNIFIPPLQRLPKITYDNLKGLWAVHKQQILEFNSQPSDDSKKLTMAQAQSILVADWFNKLADDLYDEADQSRTALTLTLFIIIGVDVLLLVVLVVTFNRLVIKYLGLIEENTISHKHTNGFAKNEIGSLAVQVNEVIEQLRDATD